MPTSRLLAPLILAALATFPARTAAQEEARFRAGISVLGTSFAALVLERVEGGRGVELSIGTWSLRDLSVSAVARWYRGSSALRPTAGAGLWGVLAWPRDGERTGVAIVARFPLGLDWRAASSHYVGLDVNVNRALWLRRVEPEERPMRRGLVPIPGLLYRYEP